MIKPLASSKSCMATSIERHALRDRGAQTIVIMTHHNSLCPACAASCATAHPSSPRAQGSAVPGQSIHARSHGDRSSHARSCAWSADPAECTALDYSEPFAAQPQMFLFPLEGPMNPSQDVVSRSHKTLLNHQCNQFTIISNTNSYQMAELPCTMIESRRSLVGSADCALWKDCDAVLYLQTISCW